MKTTQPARHIGDAPTPDQARAVARDAFIYGFPLVETYKTLYKQAIDKGSSERRNHQCSSVRPYQGHQPIYLNAPNADHAI